MRTHYDVIVQYVNHYVMESPNTPKVHSKNESIEN